MPVLQQTYLSETPTVTSTIQIQQVLLNWFEGKKEE